MNDKIEYKIILLGDSSVGKTSFFKKVTSGVFYETNISSIGMDKSSINFDIDINENNKITNKSFKITLVDTAGQERFKSLTKSFYKGADCILLIYDITNKDSFNKISYWISTINDAIGFYRDNSKYIIVVLGQKVDLVEIDYNKRAVEKEEAESMCNDNDLIWGGECSAKTFTSEELKDLLKIYVQKIYEKVGIKISIQNVKNLNQYNNKSNDKKGDLIYNDPYISYSKRKKKCCS
jgi:Ras-related protein Rab-5C